MKMINEIKRSYRVLIFILAIVWTLGALYAFAWDGEKSFDKVADETALYLLNAVDNPESGVGGDEWTVMGLARYGGIAPQSFFDAYYKNLTDIVIKKKGILHDRKYTEYSRTVLALTAMGRNPGNIKGYNLLAPLGDYDKVVWQGINGPIFALLALDSGNYDMPVVPQGIRQATREMYLESILLAQLKNGGFALSGSDADPDITGMALQALSKYRYRDDVEIAVEKGIKCLSQIQDEKGGFSESEGTSQVLTALCELGISYDDPRFVKNGKTLVDNLLSYYKKGKGFSHLSGDDKADDMATEQAFLALAGIKRITEKRNSMYRMDDAEKHIDDVSEPYNEGRNKDIRVNPIISKGKTFLDVKDHKSEAAIGALAEREIIKGITETLFYPDATMKRSEFAAITVRALGLKPKSIDVFDDVSADSWYGPYIGTAYSYGIVKGVSVNSFLPDSTITREGAAVMIARASELCGLKTAMDNDSVRNILAQFTDYTRVSEWAAGAVAFCYDQGFFTSDDITIEPGRSITRSEIAVILYNMLSSAALI